MQFSILSVTGLLTGGATDLTMSFVWTPVRLAGNTDTRTLISEMTVHCMFPLNRIVAGKCVSCVIQSISSPQTAGLPDGAY